MRVRLLAAALAWAGEASAQGAPAVPPAFAPCKACHAVEAGVNRLGPSLAGVHGRKAGSLAGYAYSDALKAYGQRWTDANLDAYLADPKAVVPGGRMTYAGQKDATKRAAIIAFLKDLK